MEELSLQPNPLTLIDLDPDLGTTAQEKTPWFPETIDQER
jgi:hypothetical protein